LIGSPKEGRRLPPPPYRRERREPWRPAEGIPRRDTDERRRRVQELHRMTRPQREALRAAGRALRVKARERRTGVPFIPYYEAA
jgi:hypothetical protein